MSMSNPRSVLGTSARVVVYTLGEVDVLLSWDILGLVCILRRWYGSCALHR